MFKNYFVVAFRHISRNKLFSLIHVLGLSVGLSASVVIFLIAQFEFSFDKFEPAGDRIYRIVMDLKFNGVDGHSAAVPAPLAAAIQDDVTGIAAVIPVMQFQGDGTSNVTVQDGKSQKKPLLFKKQSDIVFTNDSYFQMLSCQWILGSQQSSLKEPFSVVLTESRARQYFPGVTLNNVVGKELMYGKDLRTFITGIVKDLDETTDFTAQEFISYATISKTTLHHQFMMDTWNDWMAYSKTYVKLSETNNSQSVTTQLNALFKKHAPENRDPKNSIEFRLQPLRDIHFNTTYAGFGQRTAQKSTLYGLLFIAGFLLLLGCINFINLSTAQATSRAKEIGIRKTIGSQKKELIIQFLCETFCITSLSALVSISISPTLLQLFSDFIPPGIQFAIWNQPYMIAFLILLIIVVTFLSGFYPAIILSGLRPAQVLKNSFAESPTRSGAIRKVLTVSQFVIAQFFIISAFMVSKQIRYSISEDLGYRKEAIVNFEIPRDTIADHRELLMHQIKAMSQVQEVSTGFLPPAMQGSAFSNFTYHNGKEEIKENVQIRWGDPNYLSVYNISIVHGRNVMAGNNVNEALINESYAKALGFLTPQDAIGKELTRQGGGKIPIVGIMSDFHEGSFHSPIGSLIFTANNEGNTFHVAMAPRGSNDNAWQTTIEKIEKAFHAIYPDEEFSYSFFDDTLASFYIQERNMSRLLNWAMCLSIFVSCLGLLGLVIYTSEARRKEIGIRKILGASVAGIIAILSSEFVQLVLIAFAIATPVAWFSIDRWLNTFAYKTPFAWWIFAVSGLVLLTSALITLAFQTIKTATANPVKSIRTE